MRIAVSELRRILDHAEVAYPVECCGLLVGQGDRVRAVRAARNLHSAGLGDRFEIDPVDYVRIWEAARTTGDTVVGCYHSHPDGLARPSSIDREHARQFGGPFGYLVVATDGPEAYGVFAGMITEEGRIIPVALEYEL